MVKNKITYRTKIVRKALIGLAVLFLVNVFAGRFYKRIDLTKEKRFTLSTATEELLDKVDDELYVTIFLDGDLPLEYARLKSATRDMLKEYKRLADGNFSFDFEDVLEGKELKDKEAILGELFQKGLRIERPETKPDEAPTEKYIIPAGIVYYKGYEYPLNLLKREFGKPLEQEINASVELLEYEIGTVIRKCVSGKTRKLAFTSGHGELTDIETADISQSLAEFYDVERINLNLKDSNCYKIFASDVADNPDKPVFKILVEGLVKKLSTYQGLIVAKPRLKFTEPEKFVIDQYVMNGGKVIFLVESLNAEMDSIAKYGQIVTTDYQHELGDMLFHYGVKVQPTLIQDIQSHGIPAINQQTKRPGFWPWVYYPMFNAVDDNPVSKNLENVWGRYCSTLDTTARSTLKKTVLLRSSPRSRVAANPVLVSLDILKVKPNPENFRKGNQINAVLVNGSFTSPFKFREGVKRAFDLAFKDSVSNNAMIVIGDGDLIRNQTGSDGQVYRLGYDKFASKHFGTPVEFANKKFFLNCVDYLCDESNLIEVRSKEVVLRLLDKSKVKNEKLYWQTINMVIPIVIILFFGLVNAMLRRRRWR